jgi:hypothetical protein
MATTAQQSDMTYVTNRRGKHIHHGRTLAAWTGAGIALVAFILGGIAVVAQKAPWGWPLFWVSAGLIVVALIATVVLQRMGYGAN